MLFRSLSRGWEAFERNGFDATAARLATLNYPYSDENAPVQASHVLSEAKAWGEVRYGEPFSPSLSATIDLPVTRGGAAHALVVWFEATIFDDIVYSNAPGQQLVYKRIVFPLLDSVRVAVGDVARVTLRTDVGGDQWAWDTEIAGATRVRQATFFGLPASPQSLLRESLVATPSRSTQGDRAASILAMMDGTRSIREIVDTLVAAEPGVRREVIVDDVKRCARRYGR